MTAGVPFFESRDEIKLRIIYSGIVGIESRLSGFSFSIGVKRNKKAIFCFIESKAILLTWRSALSKQSIKTELTESWRREYIIMDHQYETQATDQKDD